MTNTARHHQVQEPHDPHKKDEGPKNHPETEQPPRPRSRRGFAAMDPDSVRAIARLGGKAAHSRGTAHEFTSDEARAAGRKGGLAPHKPRTSTGRSSPPPPPESATAEKATASASDDDETSAPESSPPGGSHVRDDN